jgi:hypothetical protein
VTDSIIVCMVCPHCGNDIIKTFEEPSDPPLTVRTAPTPSTPVDHPTLDRAFLVSTPVDEDS